MFFGSIKHLCAKNPVGSLGNEKRTFPFSNCRGCEHLPLSSLLVCTLASSADLLAAKYGLDRTLKYHGVDGNQS